MNYYCRSNYDGCYPFLGGLYDILFGLFLLFFVTANWNQNSKHGASNSKLISHKMQLSWNCWLVCQTLGHLGRIQTRTQDLKCLQLWCTYPIINIWLHQICRPPLKIAQTESLSGMHNANRATKHNTIKQAPLQNGVYGGHPQTSATLKAGSACMQMGH